MKNKVGFYIRLFGTIISTILFVWVIKNQDWQLVLEKLTHIHWWAILLAILLIFGSYGFNVLRWCFLLWSKGVDVPYLKALTISLGGSFASNFLPSTIGGDGFRMIAIQPYSKSKNLSVGSVVLDRIVNMSAMTCLLPFPFLIFGETLLNLLRSVSNSLFSFTFIPGLKNLFKKYFPKVMNAFQVWASKPKDFILPFLAAWPSNLLPMAGTFLLARQLGMDVTFWQVIGVQTISYFLSVLPISINGYGLREVTYTTLFSSIGFNIEQASTLALITRFITILTTLPGAFWLSTLVQGQANAEIDKSL